MRKLAFIAFLLVILLPVFAAATTITKRSLSITAENTFSAPISLISGHPGFNFSLSGTWVATVWLQRSFDYDASNPSAATWLDVNSYTANVEDTGSDPETGVFYRFGVKTGGFTSGTIVGRISQ
jgi:hypothetical protein